MSIEYTIICDGCARLLDANPESAAKARKVVRDQLGGIQRGSKDYCADCLTSQKPIEARRAETVKQGSVHERRKTVTEIEWRTVAGFPGYHVSDDGRLFSKRLRDVMALRPDRYGYLSVNLRHNGVRSTVRVHRLVCEAFHGPPPSDEAHAAHLDGDKQNNAASNLAWATRTENERHKALHGTNRGNGGMPGERHPSAKLTAQQVAEIRSSPLSSYKAAAAYGVSQGQIMRIRHGVNWRSDLPITRGSNHGQ